MRKTGCVNSVYETLYGENGYRQMKMDGYDFADFQGLVDTETPLFAENDSGFERILREERARAQEAGIAFSQTHSPWRYPPKDFLPEDRAERKEKMLRSIYGTAILGSPYMAIHPVMPFGADNDPEPQRFWDMNLEFMSALLLFAKEQNVVLCLENMPMRRLSLSTPEQIGRFVRELDSEQIKMCLDIGHCNVFGISPAQAFTEEKDLIRILHIHDNDGSGDQHLLPGDGNIDWVAFKASLSCYEGVLSMEPGAKVDLPALAAFASRLAK